MEVVLNIVGWLYPIDNELFGWVEATNWIGYIRSFK